MAPSLPEGGRCYTCPPPEENAMADEQPARDAAQRSMDYVHAKKREDWIANFTDDAHLEDPIGKSMLDPTGRGHRGKGAISAFWDRVIAPNRVMFDIARCYPCGNECANVGTITTRMENGATVIVHGVFTYRVNGEGKITNLRAYWDTGSMKVFPPLG
jgi:steroid delta-isomerase